MSTSLPNGRLTPERLAEIRAHATAVFELLREIDAVTRERDEALSAPAFCEISVGTTRFLGGCDCLGKAPTVPVYRDPMTHLDDCPAKDSGYLVGALVSAPAASHSTG